MRSNAGGLSCAGVAATAIAFEVSNARCDVKVSPSSEINAWVVLRCTVSLGARSTASVAGRGVCNVKSSKVVAADSACAFNGGGATLRCTFAGPSVFDGAAVCVASSLAGVSGDAATDGVRSVNSAGGNVMSSLR